MDISPNLAKALKEMNWETSKPKLKLVSNNHNPEFLIFEVVSGAGFIWDEPVTPGSIVYCHKFRFWWGMEAATIWRKYDDRL